MYMYICICIYIYICIVCLQTYVTNFSWVFSTPQLSKLVPINMGVKVNRFRDIHCCVEIQEML